MKKEKEIILRALGLFVRETKASIFIQEGTREPKKEAIVCYIKKKNHTYSIDFPAFRHLEKEKQEALLTILSIKEDAEEIIQKDNPPMYVLKGDLVRGSHYVMKNKKSISGYSMETPYIQDLYEVTAFHFTKEEAMEWKDWKKRILPVEDILFLPVFNERNKGDFSSAPRDRDLLQDLLNQNKHIQATEGERYILFGRGYDRGFLSFYARDNKDPKKLYVSFPGKKELLEVPSFHFTKEEAEAYCRQNKQMTAYTIEKLRTFEWFKEEFNRGCT